MDSEVGFQFESLAACLIRARWEWWLVVEEGLNIMEVGGGSGTKKREHMDEGVIGTRKKEEKPT
jgi:hypothetical protein